MVPMWLRPSLDQSAVTWRLVCVICKGPATAIEPVDNVLVGFDLLVISIGHRLANSLQSHSRYVEIYAAWKEVVVEG